MAPKLLKETANDLMFAVSAGAARQYGQKELWACADLWFWDKFPEKGKAGPGYHTPDQLYAARCPYFQKTPYFLLAGLPPMLVVDQTFSRISDVPQARIVDPTRSTQD